MGPWISISYHCSGPLCNSQEEAFFPFCGWRLYYYYGTSLILDAPYEKGIWSVNHEQRRRQFKGFSWLRAERGEEASALLLLLLQEAKDINDAAVLL